MSPLNNDRLSGVETYLKDYPHINYATPSSPDYPSLKKTWNCDDRGDPLIIARPQTAEDVSVLVKYAKTQGIKFVVRTGGHSTFGLSLVDGAMTIDMRDISYVEIGQERTTARIGGGTLLGKLGSRLHEEGLITPTGLFPTIGYVGWAMYGGYGLFSAKYGLGVDQIVGAKIVNQSGDIVDADEKLLRGIRGAGGIFGVIVEVTVKVYPMTKLLGGSIIIDGSNIAAEFEDFNKKYDELASQRPPELATQRLVVNSPMGRAIGLLFVWSSDDLESGQKWLSKFEALGNVVMNMVVETTLPDLLMTSDALVPKEVFGYTRTHSIRGMTEEVTKVIAQSLDAMPADPGTGFSIHELRGPSSNPKQNSVFGSRTPHLMLEILGVSTSVEERQKALDWANDMWKALDKTNRDNILPGTFISLDPPAIASSRTPLAKIFGEHAADVIELKREYDPSNVFDLAVPRLADYTQI